ncbi:MAG: glycosyltransferase [Phycisphaeraceae bacterium]
MPTVSVLILSHNNASYIAEAIASAISQTHKPSQVLVIDDSTDDSPGIIESFEQSSGGLVKLMRVPQCNVSRARNIGLDAASGDFLSFLDADDIWLPTKLARQVELLDANPQAVGCYALYFDFVNTLDDRQRRVPRTGADDPDLEHVLFEQNLSSSTTLFRREVMGDLRFDENSPDAEDTIFAAELRLKGRWRLIDEPLIAKRIHPNQASTSSKHRLRNVAARLRWMKDRRDAIGAVAADAMIERQTQGLIGWMEGLYWNRDLASLKFVRPEVERICPEHYARSFISRTRLLPRWMYRLRDMVTGRRGA